jgi:integrase
MSITLFPPSILLDPDWGPCAPFLFALQSVRFPATFRTVNQASRATERRTVVPVCRPNAAIRLREHLTEIEVEKLIKAAQGNRWRDSAIILIAFRHGLRASGLCGLQWSDVEFETGSLHLRRAKGRVTGTHPLMNSGLSGH